MVTHTQTKPPEPEVASDETGPNTIGTQYEEINHNYGDNINESGNGEIQTEKGGEEEIENVVDLVPIPNNGEAKGCRICRKSGESDDWLGCEKVIGEKSCEYWVHLGCLGVVIKPNVKKTLLFKKIQYFCPIHR